MLKLLTGAVALSLASCAMSPAIAEPMQLPCDTFDNMVGEIVEGYNEAPLVAGVSGQGHIMQMFVNEESGTWTVLITNPVDGTTCIADFGKDLMKPRGKPNV